MTATTTTIKPTPGLNDHYLDTPITISTSTTTPLTHQIYPLLSVKSMLSISHMLTRSSLFILLWRKKVKSLSCVRFLVTPLPVACQAPPSVGFSRQEYWSGLPFPFPDPVIEPEPLALQADPLPSEPPGKSMLTPLCWDKELSNLFKITQLVNARKKTEILNVSTKWTQMC